MNGRFIVFEGIDGCGKTTQVNQLKEWLPQSGLMPKDKKCYITREPGGTDLGVEVRKILLNAQSNDYPAPITELLLYAADRAQHVTKIIQPALEKGDWVISDRFSGSTIAYQGYGRKLNMQLIKELETIATQGIHPDITFLLNMNSKESIERRNTLTNDRIESEGKEFLQRVANGFCQLAQEKNWVKIPATLSQEIISEKINQYLSSTLKVYNKQL